MSEIIPVSPPRAMLEWVAALLGPEDPVGQSLNKTLSKGDVQLVFR